MQQQHFTLQPPPFFTVSLKDREITLPSLCPYLSFLSLYLHHQTNSVSELTFPLPHFFPLKMPAIEDLTDLTLLPDDRIDSLCRHLQSRFDNDQYYTRIGNNRMVILNPCKSTPLSMNDDTLQYYVNHGYKDLAACTNGIITKEAHLYEMATRIYFTMRRRREDQLIILR